MSALVLALAFQAAANADLVHGGTDALFAPARAADHVATIVATDGGRTRSIALMRHGDWVRQDKDENGVGSTSYSNIATNTWVLISRASDGRLYLQAQREAPGLSNTYRRTRTPDHETLLGEQCSVSSYRSLVSERPHGGGPTWLSCVTADGVELAARVLSYGGRVMSSSQMTNVERRRVSQDAVTPPRDLMRWSAWVPAILNDGPNDEVVLQLEGGSDTNRMVIRRLGGLRYEDRRSRLRRAVTVDGGGVSLHFDAGPFGRHLNVWRAGRDRREPEMRPAPLNRSEQILGQTCEWLDMSPGRQDAGQSECRTANGVTLAVTHWSRGSSETFRAIAVTRGGVTPQDVTPPRDVFTWVSAPDG